MKNLLVTVSGGRSSAMMARHIQISEKYKDYEKLYVFANTGMERPETIDFLKDIVKYWEIPLQMIEGVYSEEMGIGVRYKLVDFNSLNMTAKPFEECIAHKNKGIFSGLPHSQSPYCSEILKTKPSKKFAKDIFGNIYQTAIGYRKEDMPKRISFPEIQEDKTRIFPLITDFETIIGQKELNDFWNSQPFKLKIHNKYGNCELCWKKSVPNLIENLKKGTRFIEWYQRMEDKYESTSFRGKLSINDLVRIAEAGTQLNLFEDEYSTPDDVACVCIF